MYKESAKKEMKSEETTHHHHKKKKHIDHLAKMAAHNKKK